MTTLAPEVERRLGMGPRGPQGDAVRSPARLLRWINDIRKVAGYRANYARAIGTWRFARRESIV